MRKLFLLVLIVLYGLVILLLHDWFVQLSVVVMNQFSLPVYNVLVRNVALSLGFLLLIVTVLKSFQNKRFDLLFLFFIFCILLLLHSLFLFEMNIEIIHAVEYGLLALLIYLVTRNAGAAIVLSLPFMFLDEWVQYYLLYGNYNKYYEFNDIVLDIIGCGIFLSAYKIFEPNRNIVHIKFIKRKEFWLLSLGFVLFIFFVKFGVFAAHQKVESSITVFTLSRIENPENFWHIHGFTRAKYHILSPFAGAVFIFLLSLFSGLLDYRFYSKTAIGSPSKIV
jgi:hypothetical protein